MDLGSMLDGLLPGGADGVLNALETCAGRAPRAARASAPKEWPPACPTGLCGTQGCLCRTRARTCTAVQLECLELDFDLVGWEQLDELGSMIPPAKPPKTLNVSPARTVAAPGKRGRGRPRKKPVKEAFAELASTPPMMRPPPARAPQSLVQEFAAMLHSDARNPLSCESLRQLEGILRPAKARRGATNRLSSCSVESLYCLESLEGESYGNLLCFETLPSY